MIPFSVRSAQKILAVIAALSSAAYLCAELAFHSDLIDLLGTWPAKDQIDLVENYGRTLTGVAFALLLLPPAFKLILPYVRTWQRLAALVPSIAVCLLIASVPLSHAFIDHLVESLTQSRTAEQRKQALLSLFIVTHVHTKHDGQPALLVNDREAPKELRTTVPGRAILAALPFLLSQLPDIEHQAGEQLRIIVTDTLERELPSAERLFNDAYVPSVRALADGYERYRSSSEAYDTQIRKNEIASFADWEKYTNAIGRRRLTPGRVAQDPDIRRQVSDELRRQDASLPVGWVPTSSSDFWAHRNRQARDKYYSGLRTEGIPDPEKTRPDSLEAFMALPAVRTRWCSSVTSKITQKAALAASVCEFGPRLGSSSAIFPAFKAAVYDPFFDQRIEDAIAKYKAEYRDYADGGRYAPDAFSAAKTVIVIPVGILCSLLGGYIHVFKLTLLLAHVFGWRRYTWAVVVTGSVFLAVVAAVLPRPAALEQDQLAGAIHDAAVRQWPLPVRTMLNGLVNIERVIYPIGRALSWRLNEDCLTCP